mmetsp:Transcript_25797/g.28958  ORF Transcript_25797/g.28958 Transcript_25797/m.28958 type:complete len:86 (-) Transcript_25797:159-416(-)
MAKLAEMGMEKINFQNIIVQGIAPPSLRNRTTTASGLMTRTPNKIINNPLVRSFIIIIKSYNNKYPTISYYRSSFDMYGSVSENK